MTNLILWILIFGLGALWMRFKCARLYESDRWKAEEALRIEKLKFQQEKVRTKTSRLIDEQIGD